MIPHLTTALHAERFEPSHITSLGVKWGPVVPHQKEEDDSWQSKRPDHSPLLTPLPFTADPPRSFHVFTPVSTWAFIGLLRAFAVRNSAHAGAAFPPSVRLHRFARWNRVKRAPGEALRAVSSSDRACVWTWVGPSARNCALTWLPTSPVANRARHSSALRGVPPAQSRLATDAFPPLVVFVHDRRAKTSGPTVFALHACTAS